MKAKCFIAFLLFAIFAIRAGASASDFKPQYGIASYYSRKTNHHRTACGERLSNDSFTAAYKILPCGTYLKVTNLNNGRLVIVRINDRGPHRKKRIIDLAYAPARKLRLMNCGLARVKVELASPYEIRNKDKLNSDSLGIDSAVCEKSIANPPGKKSGAKIYRIQAGIFSLKHNAYNLKSYLNSKSIEAVLVEKIHFKGKDCYRVTIGPLNNQDKEISLHLLRAKHIKGLVTKLKVHQKKRK